MLETEVKKMHKSMEQNNLLLAELIQVFTTILNERDGVTAPESPAPTVGATYELPGIPAEASPAGSIEIPTQPQAAPAQVAEVAQPLPGIVDPIAAQQQAAAMAQPQAPAPAAMVQPQVTVGNAPQVQPQPAPTPVATPATNVAVPATPVAGVAPVVESPSSPQNSTVDPELSTLVVRAGQMSANPMFIMQLLQQGGIASLDVATPEQVEWIRAYCNQTIAQATAGVTQ